MKKKRVLVRFLIGCMSLALANAGGIGYAKVTGPCVNCHTMHNSQALATMAVNTVYGDGAYGALTKDTCLGCHTTTTADPLDGNYPRVSLNVAVSPTSPIGATAPYCAGGFFTNSGGNHNDNSHTLNSTAIPAGYSGTWYTGTTSVAPYAGLQCAGSSGCHGNEGYIDPNDAIKGGHHQTLDLPGQNFYPGGNSGYRMTHVYGVTANNGSTMGGGYNNSTPTFPYPLAFNPNGAEDYEVQLCRDIAAVAISSDSSYNIYSATNITAPGSPGAPIAPTAPTVSAFCAKCHSNFHWITKSAATGGAWIRHPTDVALNINKADFAPIYSNWDYKDRFYNPPAFNLTTPPVPGAAWAPGFGPVIPTGTDLYCSCLSCHRAHGTPYADILRFDYAAQTAGQTTLDYGCVGCHAKKKV